MKNTSLLRYPIKTAIIAVLFSTVLLTACKYPGAEPEPGSGDLTGFELSEIPGTSTKYAVRKDAAGQMAADGFVFENMRTGQWVEYNAEGEIMLSENYINGNREGLSLKFGNRGQIEQKSRYQQGVLHGPWTQYKFGKIIEERPYTMGKLDGVVKLYDDRTWKLKQEVQYKDGKQHGYFRYYDEEGNVTLEYEYKNGEKVSGGIVKKN